MYYGDIMKMLLDGADDEIEKHKLKIGKIEDLIAYRLKREKLIKLKKTSSIIVQKQKFKIKVFENIIDGSENFALIKGSLKKE